MLKNPLMVKKKLHFISCLQLCHNNINEVFAFLFCFLLFALQFKNVQTKQISTELPVLKEYI